MVGGNSLLFLLELKVASSKKKLVALLIIVLLPLRLQLSLLLLGKLI